MTLAIGWLHDGGDTVETWPHQAGDWQAVLENLDPKTWCRFPILSGGFARELRELRAELAK